MFPSRALRALQRDLAHADSSAAWQAAAEEHDRHTGADAWRASDESPCYDAELLRADLIALRTLRESANAAALVRALNDSVYRHQADLASVELYDVALSGTKHLVEAWLREAETCLRWLATNPIPGLDAAQKRARFAQAAQVYGRSALMLSGGATWGFHHLGVVKALFEADCLPHILSGASTGAMVAAGICARDDAGLRELFAHPEAMRLDGLLRVPTREALRTGAMLDPVQLAAVLRHNIGEATFGEAFAKSGRALNISVSPTRTRQKPRVLSHLTAPDVLLVSAVVASSALPGLFPPVVLQARSADGSVHPYVPSERWVDGSLAGDLPKLRLARLHNVNHFIVSQTNPHVMPFGRLSRPGVAPAVAGAAVSAARVQGTAAADFARRATPEGLGPLRQAVERTYQLVSQDYTGDITLNPRFRPELLGKLVVNPTPADLATFIREGERSVWTRLPMIRNQMRLGRVFREILAE